jgi:hypothetical protein
MTLRRRACEWDAMTLRHRACEWDAMTLRRRACEWDVMTLRPSLRVGRNDTAVAVGDEGSEADASPSSRSPSAGPLRGGRSTPVRAVDPPFHPTRATLNEGGLILGAEVAA